MPFIETNGCRLHYRFDGPENAPVLVLSNSLGTNLSIWDRQVQRWSRDFRVLRYDGRGHGGSSVPPGPYSIEMMGKDLLGLLDGLGIVKAHLCGLSMGGCIALWLGIHAGDRIERLILSNTAARIGTPEVWATRAQAVLQDGMAAVIPATLERWLSVYFRQRAPEQVKAIETMLTAMSSQGYAACCAAIGEMDQRDQVDAVGVPTLVIVGSADTATPPVDGRFLADRIAGARYVELPAAHLSVVETADQFTDTVLGFLRG